MTEKHLEFLSFKGGCTGLSESTLVKMSHCWKSHIVVHIVLVLLSAISLYHWYRSRCGVVDKPLAL